VNGPTTGKTTLEGLRLLGVLPGGQQPPKGPRPKPLATSREIAKQSAFEGMVKKPRKRRPVGQRRGRMNGWESQYWAELELRQMAGEVKWFGFEVFRVRLAGGAWYCPDFAVLLANGDFELHEVKGHWREAAMLRVKVARDKYPWIRFRAVRKVKGKWEEI
jgi:hypothetical protein